VVQASDEATVEEMAAAHRLKQQLLLQLATTPVRQGGRERAAGLLSVSKRQQPLSTTALPLLRSAAHLQLSVTPALLRGCLPCLAAQVAKSVQPPELIKIARKSYAEAAAASRALDCALQQKEKLTGTVSG
jgi:hypothetical protein